MCHPEDVPPQSLSQCIPMSPQMGVSLRSVTSSKEIRSMLLLPTNCYDEDSMLNTRDRHMCFRAWKLWGKHPARISFYRASNLPSLWKSALGRGISFLQRLFVPLQTRLPAAEWRIQPAGFPSDSGSDAMSCDDCARANLRKDPSITTWASRENAYFLQSPHQAPPGSSFQIDSCSRAHS
mmetsp:Transcript_4045/g.15231  ORF Transcript_4045/g.15231 Transcript_4045/m.15231 type:complete len:180 (-) Transcript_4045:27-566(-)